MGSRTAGQAADHAVELGLQLCQDGRVASHLVAEPRLNNSDTAPTSHVINLCRHGTDITCHQLMQAWHRHLLSTHAGSKAAARAECDGNAAAVCTMVFAVVSCPAKARVEMVSSCRNTC